MKRNFTFKGKTLAYYRIAFTLNNTTQRYEKQPLIRDFKKVATDLKIEETIDPKIKVRAEYILRGRTINGKCIFHLGLEKSAVAPLAMFRSALNDVKKSEVHIILSENYQTMTMYVFNNVRVQRQNRPDFQRAFIQHLQELNEWN